MRLCLLALLCLAGCGDDDYNGDSGTSVITVDGSASVDGGADDGGLDFSIID